MIKNHQEISLYQIYIQTPYDFLLLSPRGYLDFLLWLKDGGLDADAHWDLQSKSIAFPLESYSHVLCFENLEDTLFDFLSQCSTTISKKFSSNPKRGAPGMPPVAVMPLRSSMEKQACNWSTNCFKRTFRSWAIQSEVDCADRALLPDREYLFFCLLSSNTQSN